VLHHVPNIVPRTVKFASSHSDNNNMDDSTVVAQAIVEPVEPHHTQPQSISVDPGNSVQPDDDGAYVNPVVTENVNPDNVDVDGNSQSTDRKIGKQLTRQDSIVSEEDCKSAKDSGDGVLDHGKGSRQESEQNASLSSSSQEDALNNSTLRTFMRMVSTQATDELIDSRNASNKEQSLSEVIYVSFLF